MSTRAYISASAVLSPCGRYRYLLTRRFAVGDRQLTWVMLNPSTADTAQDDATIRKVVGFSERWGYHRADVINLFALRSRYPETLLGRPLEECVGPENDHHIEQTLLGSRDVIVAWGAHARVHPQRVIEVAQMFMACGLAPMCLGTTADGMPLHPLMPGYQTPRRAWSLPRAV